MSRTLTLPDDLVERLRQCADRQGLAVEQLLASWVDALPAEREATSPAATDDELLIACTQALRESTEPPVAVDWDDITATLRNSEPLYPTVEKALSVLRRRPWTKDE